MQCWSVLQNEWISKTWCCAKEGYILCDSIYMKCAEKADLEKAGQWFPGPWGGENGDWLQMRLGEFLRWWKSSKTRMWWWLPNSIIWIWIIELYTYNGWILWCINFTLVSLLKNLKGDSVGTNAPSLGRRCHERAENHFSLCICCLSEMTSFCPCSNFEEEVFSFFLCWWENGDPVKLLAVTVLEALRVKPEPFGT